MIVSLWHKFSDWVDSKLKNHPRLRPWVWLVILWLIGFGLAILVALPFRILIAIMSQA